MKTYLFTYCLALLLVMGLTPLVILWARKRGLVDKPDIRKIHSLPVARVGGIAIFLGIMLAIIPLFCLPTMTGQMFRSNSYEILALFITSTCIFAVGLYDDIKNARICTKLVVETLAAIVVIAARIHIDTIHIRGLSPINLG